MLILSSEVCLADSYIGGLADTPWPKYHRDFNNTGQSPFKGPQTNTNIWSYTTGSIEYSSPVIGVNGTLYIGSYGANTLYALNPNETLKWTYTTGDKISGSAAIGADGTIYVGSYNSKLYALDSNGTLKWTYATENMICGSAAIGTDGTIYIGSYDTNLYALNPDGTLKWKYNVGGTISGSAAIGADGTIYIGSDDTNLYALNPDGTLKWKCFVGQTYCCSPAIGKDRTIYIGSYSRSRVYAINPDGTLKWTFSTGKIYGSTPSIATDGTIYIGSYSKGQVYALNPDGTLKWTCTTGSIYGSSALGGDGAIYIGSGDKKVYAINPDGTYKWNYATGGTIYSSPAISADGTLYIGGYDGKLYAFKDIAPVANFNATPVLGTPLTIQFNDTSRYNPTSWAWDFGDKETSNESCPVHTYASGGNYNVTLSVANDYGSDTETMTESVVIPVVTSITVSPILAQLYPNDTQQFSAAAVDQFGKGMSGVTFTWASSNEKVGTVYSSGLFTSLSPGTTNVTVSSGNVSAFAEVTVIGPTPDLTVSSVTSTTYPISYNKVTANIKNEGTTNAGAFKTNFIVDGNTTNVEVPGLNAGNATTVSINDMVSRNAGDSIPIKVTVDPENSVAEANETNNVYTTNVNITASGDRWQGGRFSIGHDLVNNAVYEEGHVGVVYSRGGTGYTWFTKTGTVTYTPNDLPIPAGATIKSARLYQGWTWYGYPGFTVEFNGHESQVANATYIDSINGQEVFDVTPYFNASGNNTAVITAGRTQSGYYGTILIVVYEADSEPNRQIWVNEGSDCLLYGSADPYVSYTMINNVSTAGLASAKLTTILESRDGDDGVIETLNGKLLNYTGCDPYPPVGGGPDPSFMYFDATSAVQNGTNELGVNGGASYVNYANSILVVTKETASEANFTANITNGHAPIAVKFTDTSTGTPANWIWDFGDGGTSTEQNPTHIYTAERTYTVKLTVSNSLGSDSEEKTGYITVGSAVLAPVTEFSSDVTSGKAPLTVQFKDESTNTPTTWAWDFDNDGTVDNTTQNPSHTYETTGTYTVKLTATNYGGSNSTTKTDYISVTSDVSAPVTNFTTDANSGQVPFTVHFNDTSAGSVSSLKWDFGDGSTSSEQNPTHTYVTEGSYNVNLTATGPGGSTTATLPVTVSVPLTANSYNGGIPLTTAQNGTVSGGLWYDSYPGFSTSAQKTFTLPAYSKIKWARLYVTVYDGHMQNNYRGNVSIGIDANGDSAYELQKNETFNIAYSFPGEGGTGPVWLSDHMNRVTSDYLMWYDLTDSISGQTVNVQATTKKIDSSFDGRVKAMTLVVAYDDGDSDQVKYWVNQGHDTVNPLDTEYTGSTTFGTSSLTNGWSSANLTAIYLASVDGTYTFNGKTLASGVKSGSYYGANTWDMSSLLTAGQDSALAYNKQESNYYKIPLVLMSVKYPAASTALPDAAFAADIMSGTAPLTVNFTDQSTGSPTSWTWDFGDGTNATEQNVSRTYTSAGTYTVNLTVTNAGGSDSEVKTDYIKVTIPETSDTTKPVIDSVVLFPANTTAGSTISISVNATDDKEVTGVTAGTVSLVKDVNGVWQGSITAPSIVGSYSLIINASDAAGNVAETTAPYNVAQLSGSSSIAVSPKISNVAAGSNVSPAIVVKNAQNIDDTFKVWISVSELPASSQANLTWFDWTEQSVKFRAGEEVSIPVKADIPAGTTAGLKLFRVNVKSETTGISGFYTGYLKIA
jgi:PKD repeat protein